jgi:uncharacterized protein (DUF1786 family)
VRRLASVSNAWLDPPNPEEKLRIVFLSSLPLMFARLAEHYRSVVEDLVTSLRALAEGLQQHGMAASCYVCGQDRDAHGASFVADLGEGHVVRFLVSDYGISWVESRNGHELVKFEGAEAIQELERLALTLHAQPSSPLTAKAVPGPEVISAT